MAKNGLHLITPTSIAYTGTSASISANGSVTFSAVTNLELRGVFSADYDNYMLVINNWATSASSPAVLVQLLSGTTPSTTGYTTQRLEVSSTSIFPGRYTLGSFFWETTNNLRSGLIYNFYGPYLSQPTATRHVAAHARDGARIYDSAETHSVSSSYDGLKFFLTADSFSGRVAVYGMRK